MKILIILLFCSLYTFCSEFRELKSADKKNYHNNYQNFEEDKICVEEIENNLLKKLKKNQDNIKEKENTQNNNKNLDISLENTDKISLKNINFLSQKISFEKNKKNIFFQDSIDYYIDKYNIYKISNTFHNNFMEYQEFISNSLASNIELGIGTGINSDLDNSNNYPFYTTGRFFLPNDSMIKKYLKFNLGYSFSTNTQKEQLFQDSLYYGFGGGIIYQDFSLNLMYQLTRDNIYDSNSFFDDRRITFFFNYDINF